MTPRFEIPEIETERLRLRLPAISDLDTYAEFRASDRAIFVGGPFDRAASYRALTELVGQWHLRGYGRWMITDRLTGEPLGVTGIYHPEDWPERELAWSLFASGEGRGIAYEAALAARRFAYETYGWTRLISCVAPENTRSVALAQRLGAEFEGTHDVPDLGLLHVWRHPGPDDTTTHSDAHSSNLTRPT
ncbi:MAG: GNAT family N-acetyltransferase [Pseudomonadota bacterium]